MFAVKGLYDGTVATPQEAVPFKENYEVVITFLQPLHRVEASSNSEAARAERIKTAKSLFGILPPGVSDAEIREERLKRYENRD